MIEVASLSEQQKNQWATKSNTKCWKQTHIITLAEIFELIFKELEELKKSANKVKKVFKKSLPKLKNLVCHLYKVLEIKQLLYIPQKTNNFKV